jgi:hypothetical protein
MNIGRNELCPCGSGKKYKHCCINAKHVPDCVIKPEIPRTVIMVNGIGDYGEPKVNDAFFKRNPWRELAAQRILYTCMVAPQLEALASQLVKQEISRGRDEEKKIGETNNLPGLIGILKQNPDPLNQQLLRRKLLQFREEVVPLLLEELGHIQNDCFVEQAVRIIYMSGINCSAALLKLISSPIDAYALSLICVLLGLLGRAEALKPLWDCFHFFKEKYPEESFSQGPLLGLYELRERVEKGT